MPDPQSRAQATAIRLQAVTDEILDQVQQLPPELLTWQLAPGVWSVMDILCHIAEFVPYWTIQTTGVVRHPEIAWGRDHTDQDRLAAVANTSTRPFADVQQAIRRAVRESAGVLSHMTDADFAVESASRNPRWGVKPASFIVDHLLVQHVEKHLGQIRRNVSQYQQGRPSTS